MDVTAADMDETTMGALYLREMSADHRAAPPRVECQ
jgi:hypothetical protein